MHWLCKHSKNGLQVVAASRAEAIKELSRAYNLRGMQRASLAAVLWLKIPRKGTIDIVTCDCTDGKHAGEI